MKKISYILSSLILFCSFSVLGGQSNSIDQKGEDLISKVTSGAKLTRTFVVDKKAHLYGHVLQAPQRSKKMLVYTMGGQYVFVGTLIKVKGPQPENLSKKYEEAYIRGDSAKRAYEFLKTKVWFVQGDPKAPHKLTVMVDFNCRFCNALFKALTKPDGSLKRQDLEVRWVPVGFLEKSSTEKAIAILTSFDSQNNRHFSNPLEAFVYNEKTFTMGPGFESGGISPLTEKDKDKVKGYDRAKAAVEENTKFFFESGFGGTPTLIYKQKKPSGKVTYGYISGYLHGQALESLIDSLDGQW